MIQLRKINTKDRTSLDYKAFKKYKLQVIQKIYSDGLQHFGIRDSDTEIYTDGDVSYNIDHRKAKVMLIEYNGKAVGCIEYYLDKHPYDYSKKCITLNILGVDPIYRGKGIGREALKQFISKTNYTIFLSHFFGTARDFYKQIGGVVVEEKIMLKKAFADLGE